MGTAGDDALRMGHIEGNRLRTISLFLTSATGTLPLLIDCRQADAKKRRRVVVFFTFSRRSILPTGNLATPVPCATRCRASRHTRCLKGTVLSTTFADLGVPTPLVEALAADGLINPFPIQVQTLPDTLSGRDVLGRGKTGSGKTLAFSIPLAARLAGATRRPARPSGRCGCPGRRPAHPASARCRRRRPACCRRPGPERLPGGEPGPQGKQSSCHPVGWGSRLPLA